MYVVKIVQQKIHKGIKRMIKIRLARHGAKKRPFYKIVIANSTTARNGMPIAYAGFFNPLTKDTSINVEVVKKWIEHGAQMSSTFASIYKKYLKNAAC